MAQAVTHHLDFQKPSLSWPLWRVLSSLIRSGHLKVRDWKGESHEFGDKSGKTVAIHFRDPKVQRALLFDPQIAIAEGYMDGRIEIEAGTIYDLLSLLARNLGETSFQVGITLPLHPVLQRFAKERDDVQPRQRFASRFFAPAFRSKRRRLLARSRSR